jgi:oxygen-independent coproporphyrinogen III oxidase
MAGIYLHIPFCKQACYYCDFYFSTNQELRGEMTDAMIRELHIQKSYLGGENVTTIYFGGGTPSVLSEAEISNLLRSIRALFPVSFGAEITVEANPDDLTPEKLNAFAAAGINRLSIGIQSFHDSELRFMNRAHSGVDAIRSVNDARNAGFKNISIDLIYGMIDQSLEKWKATIATTLHLAPEHISAYSLTIEEKTVFGKWAKQGKLKALSDDLSAEHLTVLIDSLERAGYEQYEVSNFARPGFISRHNSNYWKNEKYLGIGPSAHSFDLETRQFNIANNALYLGAIKAGKVPFQKEALTAEDRINDYILTGLRTKWGIDLKKLSLEFNDNLIDRCSPYIQHLMTAGLAERLEDTLILTRAGKMLADKIAVDLFLVNSD